MNTQIKTSPLIGFCVTFGLMALAVGPMIVLVNSTPDRIPADVTAEEIDAAQHEDVNEKEKTLGVAQQVRSV